MFFFLKKKEIVLDCFTHSLTAYDHAKIDYARNHYPDWWYKQTKKNEEDWPTIKYCKGIKEFYNNGIVILSWFSMNLLMNSDGQFVWTSSNHDVSTDSSHPQNQFDQFALLDGHNIKITSPWSFRCNKDILFTWTQPTWGWRDMLKDVSLLPGVMSFKYQNITNINLFIQNANPKEKKYYHIEARKPLVILHPMTEQKVVLKNHLVDEKEWKRFHNMGAGALFVTDTFEQKITHSAKRNLYVKTVLDKCPFHK